MGKSKGKSDDRSQQVLQVGLIIHLCGVVTQHGRKGGKCNRGAPYIYWGYSRWVLASTIVALSQYGSKPEGVGLLWEKR